MTPEELNTKWEVLIAKFDSYYKSLPKNTTTLISSAFGKWQDWYYGTDQLPKELPNYIDIFNNSDKLLTESIKLGDKPKAIPYQKASKPAVKGETIYIYGKPPKPYLAIAGLSGILGSIVYLVNK